MECGFGRFIRQFQPLGGAQDGTLGGIGGFGDMRAEAAQSGDFRSKVMGSPFPPCGIRAVAGPGCPERLATVEVARSPQAEAAIDHGRPVDSRRLRCKLCHRGQSLGGGCGRQHPRPRPSQIAGLHRASRGDQRRGKVIVGDLARGDFCRQLGARLRQGDPRHPRQPGRSLGQILMRLAEEGVYSHGGIQREGGRDGAGGGFSGKQKL